MIRLFSRGTSIKFVNYGIFRDFFLTYEFPLIVTKSSFPKLFFHSSSFRSIEITPEDIKIEEVVKSHKIVSPRRKFDNVDWLPFSWQRHPCHNPFEDSGDLVKDLEYDPSWPKPDFELSDELKTANDEIKHRYSLATASQSQIKEAIKRRWFEKIQRHPNDFNSLEVMAANYTLRVRGLFEHSKINKKDRRGGRRILNILIKRRNRCLKLLYRTDLDRFHWICKELKVEYTPSILGGVRERYTRKWDLRRLTKEYIAKMKQDNKNAYHEELKKQQVDFLKEKEETLMWMEQEKEEIARITEEIAVTTKEFERLTVK